MDLKRISRKVNSKEQHKIVMLYLGLGRDNKCYKIDEIAKYLKTEKSYVVYSYGKAIGNISNYLVSQILDKTSTCRDGRDKAAIVELKDDFIAGFFSSQVNVWDIADTISKI